MRHFLLYTVIFLASCSYQIKVKTGDQAFSNKQYNVAILFYKEELNQSTNQKQNALQSFRIGQCYKYVSDFEQSLKWFKKAYDLNYGLKALEEYANALKNNGEYEAAISAFQELSQELDNPSEYRKEIAICRLNIEWKRQQNEYYFKLTKLAVLNDQGSDYSPVVDNKGNFYFVSDRFSEDKGKNQKFAWSGRSYSDILQCTNKTISPFHLNINSAANEGSFCFDSKMQTIYFTRCGGLNQLQDYCNLFYASFKDGNWSKAEWLDFGFESCNIMHPALHKSDSILVFSSNVVGGIGQYDLYVTFLRNDAWSTPINLGETINSPLDEKFPVWNQDTLYFSSNGWPGLGGLDIFKSYKSTDQLWQPAINLKPNLNSEADDFGYFIDTSFVMNDSVFLKGYLSSNRNETNDDEIYLVELKKRLDLKPKEKEKKFQWEVQLNIQFVSHESYKQKEKLFLDSVDLIEKISKNSINTKSRSKINLKVLPGENYTFLASRKNYLNREFKFSTPVQPELTKDSLFILDLEVELIPIVFDEEFILEELYYDFDKWEIRADAISALEKLKTVLFTNPGIKIELGSHTDCRGDDVYNFELSEKRAKSATDWLVNNGIQANRLQYKGYGEFDMAISCECNACTEDQHQKNRRTTFKIVK
ncbi:MAG: OmpA family protein [Saprospiraceae bacterium]|nr:OmpA family protein [Saprospiraceae bacterium]